MDLHDRQAELREQERRREAARTAAEAELAREAERAALSDRRALTSTIDSLLQGEAQSNAWLLREWDDAHGTSAGKHPPFEDEWQLVVTRGSEPGAAETVVAGPGAPTSYSDEVVVVHDDSEGHITLYVAGEAVAITEFNDSWSAPARCRSAAATPPTAAGASTSTAGRTPSASSAEPSPRPRRSRSPTSTEVRRSILQLFPTSLVFQPGFEILSRTRRGTGTATA
ncbi:hypothetical protein [Streptomyces viridosporus]|uniref:hypothetical protein n=1 Tax=Streptomyces viridosporus TaxID=67581 RepID=UPI0009BD0C1A|nr:hypothetical protein [Streptomyces viridosporus]